MTPDLGSYQLNAFWPSIVESPVDLWLICIPIRIPLWPPVFHRVHLQWIVVRYEWCPSLEKWLRTHGSVIPSLRVDLFYPHFRIERPNCANAEMAFHGRVSVFDTMSIELKLHHWNSADEPMGMSFSYVDQLACHVCHAFQIYSGSEICQSAARWSPKLVHPFLRSLNSSYILEMNSKLNLITHTRKIQWTKNWRSYRWWLVRFVSAGKHTHYYYHWMIPAIMATYYPTSVSSLCFHINEYCRPYSRNKWMMAMKVLMVS